MAHKKPHGEKAGAKRSPDRTTLKDMLAPELLQQLQSAKHKWQAEEERRAEQLRRQAAERRKQEQEQLENNFEYLLNQSDLDWKKFK
jgi:hypothetical protein